jgi:hypothetical protein
MKCPEFHQQLQAVLDGGVTGPDEAARAHLRSCPSCRELSGAAELLRSLPSQPELLPPPGFTERVVAGVLWDRRRQNRVRWWSVSAVAAAVLIGVGLWSMARLLNPPPAQPDVAKNDSSPPRLDTPPSLDQARALGRNTLERTRQAAEDAARQASILMPPTSELSTPHLAGLDPVDVPMAEVGKSVSDGLEPVTKNTRRAFDAWLNLLPMGGDDKPGLQ